MQKFQTQANRRSRNLTQQQSVTRSQLLPPPGHVALNRLLYDVYEYHGLFLLLLALVFFLFATAFLYAQWGGFTSIEPAFKSTVVESMKSYVSGPTIEALQSQQPVSLDKVDTMLIGASYMTGYLRSIITKTKPLNLANNSLVWVGPFASVTYARILANVQTNCDLRRSTDGTAQLLECCYECTRNASSAYNSTQQRKNFLNSSIWSFGRSNGSYNHQYEYIATVLGPNITLDAAEEKLRIIGGTEPPVCDDAHKSANSTVSAGCDLSPVDLPTKDHAFIGQYVGSLKLQFIANNRMGNSSAYFTMSVMYGTYKNHKTVQMITANSIPVGFTPIVYVWFVCFVIFTIGFTIDVASMIRLSYLQTGGFRRAFKFWWNCITVLSQLLNIAWIFWFLYLLGRRSDMGKTPMDNKTFDDIENLADSYMQFLYFGLVVLFMLGLRICRFMRVHLGMKALYHVFVDVTKNIIDFAVFAVYIMMVLGGITFAYFQINGGNPLFVEFPDGISAMARLAFNFLDFHEFENDAVGMNVQWSWTRTFIFWVSMVVLTVFMNNMIIAIFNSAYEKAQKKSEKKEFFFITIALYRVLFWCYCYFWVMPHCAYDAYINCNKDSTTAPDSTTQAHDYDAHHISSVAAPDQSQHNRHGGATVTSSNVDDRWLPRFYNTFMRKWNRAHLRIMKNYREGSQQQDDAQEQRPSIRDAQIWKLFARWTVVMHSDLLALTSLYMDFAMMKVRSNPKRWEIKRKPVGRGSSPAPRGRVGLAGDQDVEDQALQVPLPAINSDVDRAQLKQLLKRSVQQRKALEDESTGFGSKLMSWITYSPFNWLPEREQDIDELVEAILAVYAHVERPYIDSNDDGTPDEQQGPEKELADLKQEVAKLTQEVGQLLGLLQARQLTQQPEAQPAVVQAAR